MVIPPSESTPSTNPLNSIWTKWSAGICSVEHSASISDCGPSSITRAARRGPPSTVRTRSRGIGTTSVLSACSATSRIRSARAPGTSLGVPNWSGRLPPGSEERLSEPTMTYVSMASFVTGIAISTLRIRDESTMTSAVTASSRANHDADRDDDAEPSGATVSEYVEPSGLLTRKQDRWGHCLVGVDAAGAGDRYVCAGCDRVGLDRRCGEVGRGCGAGNAGPEYGKAA